MQNRLFCNRNDFYRYHVVMANTTTYQGDVWVLAGQSNMEGQAVVELETDKAVIEVPSTVSGVIEEIVVAPSARVKVGDVLFTYTAESAGEKPAQAEQPAPAAQGSAAEPVAQKPAVEEAKPTAGAAAAAKPEAQNSAAEKASDGKSDEKPIAAKADSEAPSAKSAGKPTGRTSGKSGEEKAGAADEGESYHLAFKSSPIGAEVLIDGEYFGRTPCDRRVLDPKKSIAITFRREGYEPHERMIGASDNWVKKGNDRVLTVSANLKKVVKPAAGVALPASPEAKTQRAPEPAPAAHSQAKPAAPPTSAPAKPAAPAPEIARPAAPKPELAKPAASASEPAKPTPAPTPKPPVLKPVPNFDEPSKAKE